MFRNRVTDMLGIEYPILQGAMQWLSRAEVVAAVSNAGGLGIISALTFSTAHELRCEIEKTRTLTDKPFAVNVTLIPTIRDVNYTDYIEASLEAGVRIIETSGRSPELYMKLIKDAGAIAMHKVTSVRHARTAEHMGADAVIIIGFEAAGHPGMEDVTSLVLIPRVVDAVKIPVIAGGGIGDARGLIAVLALGAEGVLIGTRFMASRECNLPEQIKQRLINAEETDTLIIERSIKNASRVLKTDFSQKVLELEMKGVASEEILFMANGEHSMKALTSGDINAGVIHCGQVVGQINDIPSIKEIIDSITNQAGLIEQQLGTLWRRERDKTTGDA